jgi:hypothetical protein
MAQKRNKLDEIVPVAIILDGEGTPVADPALTMQKPRLKIDNTFFLMISLTAFLEIG